ncbi:MAG: histidine--tRNA ligase, partial [Candidatus Moranbacteria bacterium]|nr:histidine--tRNA ligase [Candidatus Moranbacteria bacterium]
RQQYHHALKSHFEPDRDTLCEDCNIRIDKNPLRILDCKVDQNHPALLKAPTPQDYLNADSRQYFGSILEHLHMAGINYEIANRLVRGLDYYSHTVFEIEADIEGFGAQNVLGGGGRYQKLVKELGGPDLGGIGFAFGMERLLMAIEAENVDFAKEPILDAFILTFHADYRSLATKILYELRKVRVSADMNYTQKSFKSQLKQAIKQQAKYLIIIGEDEYKRGVVGIKNTQTEVQDEVIIAKIPKYFKERLGK